MGLMSVENLERRDLTEYHRPQTGVADKWAALIVRSGRPGVAPKSISLRNPHKTHSRPPQDAMFPSPAGGPQLSLPIKMGDPSPLSFHRRFLFNVATFIHALSTAAAFTREHCDLPLPILTTAFSFSEKKLFLTPCPPAPSPCGLLAFIAGLLFTALRSCSAPV